MLYKKYDFVFLKYYRNLHWLFLVLAIGFSFAIKYITYIKNYYAKFAIIAVISLLLLMDITSANNTKTFRSSGEDISKKIPKNEKILLLPWKLTGDYYYYYLVLYGVENDLNFFIRTRDRELDEWYKKNKCLISLECEMSDIKKNIDSGNLNKIGVKYIVFHINTKNEKPYDFPESKIKKIQAISEEYKENVVFLSDENLILKF